MIAHCLFEQSGTFKNEFKKLGVESYDYDILNDYGQTDYQIDLFMQIKNAWGGGGEHIRPHERGRHYNSVLPVYNVPGKKSPMV